MSSAPLPSASPLNRRTWLKATGLAAAGLALGTPARVAAQHEADRSAGPSGPAKISGNENPYGPSALATMAIMQQVENAARYPSAGDVRRLVELIAAKNGVSPDQVLLGNGSSEVLSDYATWLTRKSGPGEVVTALPGYLKFTESMAQLGSKIVTVPTDANLVHDLDAMAAKIGPDTKCVYICNPNNPTSTIVPADRLKAFAIEASKRCPVFVDEAYLELSDRYEENTMAALVAAGHNVVVARTFSKMYGMAGVRMGYGLMPADDAKGASTVNSNHLGVLAVAAAIASLEDDAYVVETRAKVKAERDKLCALLKQLGRKYAEPQGNFVFVHTGMPVRMFQEKMAAENVLVGRAFPPALDWCRISIGLPEEMAMCHAALKKVFAA